MAKASLLGALAAASVPLAAAAAASDDQCGVYLAESSTDHALGSFAGRPYVRDEAIGSRDAIVQFVDIREHNRHLAEEEDGR